MSEGYREMLFGLSGLKQDQQAGTAAVLSFNLIRDVSGALIVSMDNGAQAMQLELCEQDVDRLRTALDCAQPAAIPLSERKPGRGDCDDQGRCWSFDPLSWTHNELVPDPHDREHRILREVDGPSWELRPPESGDTHWLPASVQFLPARVEG